MKKTKRRQKSCAEIALTRARQALRQKKHPVVVCWVFITALLSISAPAMSPATLYRSDKDNDWPISDYERGYSTSRKPRRERYSEQPSMKRLMHDLRRPAAREDATQFLLARIDNVALRGWVFNQIREDQINRLALHVHPGLPDNTVIASWQAELDSENTANDEAINDALQTQQTPRHSG
ncbi:hypothetical protein [Brucella tritici]|uniref:Uncharacterized protein n=1 Tax=Brucella tritici TaxID=94626 RepID=A0A6L3YDL4_9HYPH|nr:hypothetical protein [Brucella tritici]KAB2681416.1 hypothetical protein F9L08_19230 [Brucella tritici]